MYYFGRYGDLPECLRGALVPTAVGKLIPQSRYSHRIFQMYYFGRYGDLPECFRGALVPTAVGRLIPQKFREIRLLSHFSKI